MTNSTRYSFASFGCAAFADNHRTHAYHMWALENGLYPTECCPSMLDCSCETDDPLVPYVDPITDPAPWYDATLPESAEFLGMMITNITGIRDSTFAREVADSFGDGSVLGRPRFRGRSFVIEGVVFGTSCAGIDYGLEWLRRLLEDEICACSATDPCAACSGKQLTVRVFCSDDDPCDIGVRTWDSVGVVDGVKVIDDEELKECCCTVRRITMTLQSESPYSFNCEMQECDLDAGNAAVRWTNLITAYDPIGWWKLDEFSGLQAYDSSANSNHDGVYTGLPLLAQPSGITNEISRSVLFDDINDEVVVPDATGLDFGTGPFTVVSWFRKSTLGGLSALVSKKFDTTVGSAGWWVGFNVANDLVFQVSNGVTQVTHTVAGAGYLDDAWHMVVVGRDAASNTFMSVDGVVVGTPVAAALNVTNAIDLHIGSLPGDAASHFDGYIDDSSVYEWAWDNTLNTQPAYAAAASGEFFTKCYDWVLGCRDCSNDQSCCDRCGYDALCTCYPIQDPEIVIAGSECYCEPLEKIIQCCCVEDIGQSYDNALVIDIYSGSIEVGQSSYKTRIANNPTLVSYWRLGEVGGTVANDNEAINDGTYVGSPSLGEEGALLLGDPDTAVRFDRVNDYVEVPFSASINTASFTVEAWVDWNMDSTSDPRIISSRNDTVSGEGFEVLVTAASLVFRTRTTGGANHDLSVPAGYMAGGYKHVVGTYDAGTQTKNLYVNGVLVATAAAVTYAPNTARPTRFGASSMAGPANFFGGKIDEVAIYNTALIPSLIADHHAHGVNDDYFNEIGMRNLRIRVFDNPDDLACITDEESYDAWCPYEPRFELTVDYVPADSTLTIDGRRERVVLDCDGVCRPYDQVVTSTSGNIFPLVTGCDPMMVCIEYDALNTQLNENSAAVPASVSVRTYRRWFN